MKIIKNVGRLDRMVRLSLAVVSLMLALFFFSGMQQTALYVVSAAMFLTGVVGYCGLYAPFGKNTCAVDEETAATVELKVVLVALIIIVLTGFYFGNVSIPKAF